MKVIVEFLLCVRLSSAETGGGGGGGGGGRLWEKHTSSYTSDSNQFQSRAGRNFCTNEPEVPRLEKNKFTEVKQGGGGGNEKERGRKKNFSGFQLANKKAKQSIMSESPHSWPLLPGSGRMKSDKTRICKLTRSFWTAGRGGGGGGGLQRQMGIPEDSTQAC